MEGLDMAPEYRLAKTERKKCQEPYDDLLEVSDAWENR